MSLAPGARLGPYEIVSRLGAGGMGEVFRARDTRLDRIVALKALPPDRVADAEARARFAREAKAIAALNHPNICAIHDVGLTDAAHPPFLVMELLEGVTLQERLLKGPLDVEQIVDVGAALADALDTAHARGLIHRDLKPANIFLTSRGIPKILDFGLAKALEPDASRGGPETDETRLGRDALTELGSTVGTVAYMSPEQLRGEPLDIRSDLFSFGLVLYEMATGQRAFAGATSAVVSAAILTAEPAAPTASRPDLPPRLEETILKALEKDRNVRCQTAAELRADLLRLKRQSGSQVSRAAVPAALPPRTSIATMSGTGSGPAVGPSPAPGGSSTRTGWIAAAALGVVAIAGAIYFVSPPAPGSSPAPAETAAPPATRAAQEAAVVAPVTPAGTPAPAPPPLLTPTPPAPPPESKTSVPPPAVADDPRGDPRPPGPRGRAPGGPGRRGLMPNGPALISILQGLPPLSFDLAYAAGDPGARDLAIQLRGVLTNAGWTNVATTEVPPPPAFVTVLVPQTSQSATALVQWARRNNFEPDVRVMPRLPRVRIVIGRPR